MKKILTLSLIAAAAVSGSSIGQSLSAQSITTTSMISGKKLSKQIADDSTLGLIVSTSRGLVTHTGSSMKGLVKKLRKGKNDLSIVGVVASTDKGIHTSLDKTFSFSKKLGKQLKLTAGSSTVTATLGKWDKKTKKMPLSIARSDAATMTTTGAIILGGKPAHFKI